MSTATYNFTQVKKVHKWEVFIDTDAKYGYFEHDEEGEGGGLWFIKMSMENEAGFVLELEDYDGRSYLPKAVIQAIRELGHIVDKDFE
jgi:hypothetical protein